MQGIHRHHIQRLRRHQGIAAALSQNGKDFHIPLRTCNREGIAFIWQRLGQLHLDALVLTVYRFLHLDTGDHILPIAPFIALYAGGNIDMDRAGQTFGHIDELVLVHILFCPVWLFDDKSNAGGSIRHCKRSNHFSILLCQRNICSIAALHPEPDTPSGIIPIRTVIVKPDGNT